MATVRASAVGGATSGSADRTAAITPAVGDLLVVFAAIAGNTNAAVTCSDNNGGTYTPITTALRGTSVDIMSCFVRNSLVPNTTVTTVTVASGANTAGQIIVVALSGMARAGALAIQQWTRQENIASGTPTHTFTVGVQPENLLLVAAANATTSPAFTQPTGFTELQDTGQATPTITLAVASLNAGSTDSTITWGAASATPFASIALEIAAAPVTARSGVLVHPIGRLFVALGQSPGLPGLTRVKGVQPILLDRVPAVVVTIVPSGIASAQAFGTTVVLAARTITLTAGIATAEAFGSHIVSGAAPQTITLTTGIASAQAFGTPLLVATIAPSGIASAQAVGTPTLSLSIAPGGIASAQAFGTALLSVQIPPFGIPSAEAFGSAIVRADRTITLTTGIASAQAFGTAVITTATVIIPTGIPSAQALGSPLVKADQTVTLTTGIPSAEAFGTPLLIVPRLIVPTGIPSAQAFGSATLHLTVLPTGIVSAQSVSTPTVLAPRTITLTAGIPSAEAFGTASLLAARVIVVTGIPSAQVFGSAALTLHILPTGLPSAQAFGTATLKADRTILPGGIPSAEAVGLARVTADAVILPGGIPGAEAFGTPSLLLGLQGSGGLELGGSATIQYTRVFAPPAVSDRPGAPMGPPRWQTWKREFAIAATGGLVFSGTAEIQHYDIVSILADDEEVLALLLEES